MIMRTNWKGRLCRTLVVLGLAVCLVVNVLLARLHHERTRFMQPVKLFADFYQVAKTSSSSIVRTINSTAFQPLVPLTKGRDLYDSFLPQAQHDDHSNSLPKWMRQYSTWHKTQRSLLNATNYDQFKYLVMICREHDKCGGTADRLKPFLLMLLVAYQSQRIFLISWEQPCRLEEFLIPPLSAEYGLDWRMPDYLRPLVHRNKRPATTLIRLIRSMNFTKLPSLNVRYQSFDVGSDYYNQHRPKDDDDDDEKGEPRTFDKVYPHAWRMLFTPVPPIATKIQHSLQKLQLDPGNYIGAHVRAFRGVSARNPATIRNLTMLALYCVSQLIPVEDGDMDHNGSSYAEENLPIFFASDSSLAVEIALEFGNIQNATIVTRSRPPDAVTNGNNKNPLHLERSATTRSELKDPSEYYDTFIDLYLLSMSRCMSYNIGGFGHWASLLSYNSSCHFRYNQLSICQWSIPKRSRRRVTF